MIVKGEFSNILFLCELVVASGQEERLIFTHFIPDYSHFLQNKLIKAHQNKLVKARNENDWNFEREYGFYELRCFYIYSCRLQKWYLLDSLLVQFIVHVILHNDTKQI